MDRQVRRRLVAFWVLGALVFAYLFGASAPSPLYPIYQQVFGFSAITVTAIYGAYAASGLAGLLVSGRVSDYVGRRPVVVVGLLIQIAGMLAFIAAQGEALLYVGRLLQGLGTGMAIGALSAWLVDLQPPDNPRLGALVAGTATMLGLGAGGLGAAVLVQFAPDPLRLVYWLLAVVYLCALLAMPFIPDVVQRQAGWLRSLRPDVGVPSAARPLFVALLPSLIATWALAGLYLSLGPALATSLTGANTPLAGGLVIVTLLGTGAVASVVVRDADPRRLMIRGSLLLVAGVAVTLAGVALGSVAALFAGSFIAGLGFGPAFSAVLRSLVPLAPVDKRAALLAAVFVVVYVSFSVPTIAAGMAVNGFGLRAATYGYGIAVIVLAVITTYAMTRRVAPAG